MVDTEAHDAGVARRRPTMSPGWTIVVGVTALVVSAFTFVLVPVVAALVVVWWLATDALVSGSRAPARLGKLALVMLAVVWAAVAWVVAGFDAHFDCGGTLGGYGESASARLDEDCYGRRVLAVPLAVAVVMASTAGAGVRLRRRARSASEDGTDCRSPVVSAALAVGACVLGWSAMLVLIVVR